MVVFQLLGADYILKDNKPVVRLFGRSENDSAVCVFVENYMPYFYVKGDDEKIIKKLNLMSGKVKKIEGVEKFLSVGYYSKPTKMLKITLYNPKDVPVIRDDLEKESFVDSTFEADIMYKYRFLVDHKLHGMDWVEADGDKTFTGTVSISAYHGKKIKKINRDENSNLHFMAFDVECAPEDLTRPMDYDKDPLIMISLAFEPKYRGMRTMVISAKPVPGRGFPKNVKGFLGEKEMLQEFLKIVEEYDPDILSGYNINNFDMPYVLKRLVKHGLPQNFGRAKDKNVFCRTFGMNQDCTISGRIVVDPYQILKNDPMVRLQQYSLNNVAKILLNDQKLDVKHTEMKDLWQGDAEDFRKLLNYSEKDADLTLRLLIDKGLLDKFFELSKVSGLLLQDALGGQAIRVETRILHDFRDKNFVMPNRPNERDLARRLKERKKNELKGGMVLDPVKGLHAEFCTLVLDFLSLYPSIIRAYNVSPDALVIDKKDAAEKKTQKTPAGALFIDKSVREGVLPRVLGNIMEARDAVKKKMKLAKDPGDIKILDAKQNALKILANSFYGYTGYIRARLYAMDVANGITSYGRNNILKTKELIEKKYPVDVIYMDTDSAFIKTKTKDLDEAGKTGEEISKYITGEFEGNLVLEFEKIYRTFLILTKKRYAGWMFTKDKNKWNDKIEMKGIETVRRDWCPLVSETMEDIINIILKDGDLKKAMEHVKGVLEDIKNGKIPIEKLTIVKGITKKLEGYAGILPHIELARKLKRRNPESPPLVGERIPFVIIKGNQMLSKRAENPMYAKEHKLRLDADYYINSQLLPPIERIMDAVGITRSELVGNGRQISIHDIMNNKKRKMKHDIDVIKNEETIKEALPTLEGWEDFICQSCKKSHRRMTLSGRCECGGRLLISHHGNMSDKCLVK